MSHKYRGFLQELIMPTVATMFWKVLTGR